MLLSLSPKSDTPMYRQIVSQIQARIGTGQIRVGTRLPPVRELAKQLRTNPKTVARAYRELERQGLVDTRGGRGTFVAASRTVRGSACRETDYRGKLAEAIAAGISMGIGRARATAVFEDVWEAAFAEDHGSDEQERAIG